MLQTGFAAETNGIGFHPPSAFHDNLDGYRAPDLLELNSISSNLIETVFFVNASETEVFSVL